MAIALLGPFCVNFGRVISAIYIAFSRLLYTAAFSWAIVASCIGYGGKLRSYYYRAFIYLVYEPGSKVVIKVVLTFHYPFDSKCSTVAFVMNSTPFFLIQDGRSPL